jgi:cytochrome c oxidase subunit II
MFTELPLFPEQASTLAGRVDALYFFMVAVSAFFTILIAVLVIYFAIRFRRRYPDETGARTTGGLALETIWIVIPFGIAMVMFGWGASVYFSLYRPPDDALDVYVVGKQWMWKFQHVGGQREINELHVPVGRPVRLIIGSEDVIHSVFVPAFRTKIDAVPGRTTVMWFEATRPGRYRLFCAEYCGTLHSGMVGWVVALEAAEYQEWLAGGPVEGSPAALGEKLFHDLSCYTCHRPDAPIQGPPLEGLFGSEVLLADGRTVVADEGHIREAILTPQSRVRAGFAPVMPSYQGLVNETQIQQLIAYIRSLADRPQVPVPEPRLEPPPTLPGGAEEDGPVP